MANTIPIPNARFETTLATSLSASGTTFTLTSATDKAGNALSGRYAFAIDQGTSSEEFVSGDVSGTTVTIYKRGLDPAEPETERAALKLAHYKGASVKITDWALLGYMYKTLMGASGYELGSVLSYASPPTWIGGSNQLATVKKVEDTASFGAPDAAVAVKGIGRVSVAPVSSTIPIFVGDNDGRVPTQGENDALVGNNTDIAVGTSNKMVTQTGLQHGAEKYAVDTSGSSTAYVAALSPVPTSLTAGMEVVIKFVNANTTTTPTLTLTGTATAKTIVKAVNTALAIGDIAANQIYPLVYDGTNFVLQAPVATATPFTVGYKSGVTTRTANAASGSQTIAHGLGITPKYIRITTRTSYNPNNTATSIQNSDGTYNGSATACVWNTQTQFATGGLGGTDTTNIIHYDESGQNTNLQTAVATFDATNITLTWTKTGSPSNAAAINILWEAIA